MSMVISCMEVPILLLFCVMGVEVHNLSEVLLQSMLMVKGVQAYNLREVIQLLQFGVMLVQQAAGCLRH